MWTDEYKRKHPTVEGFEAFSCWLLLVWGLVAIPLIVLGVL